MSASSPSSRLPRPAAGVYAWAVTFLGAAAVVGLLIRHGAGDLHSLSTSTLVLVLGAILGEALPIRIPRRDHQGVFSVSGPFVLALLLSAGLTQAVVAQALASLVVDVVERRSVTKSAFNAGQGILAVLAAGAVLSALSGVPHATGAPFDPGDLPAILAAAVTFTVANNVLVAVVIALASSTRVITHLRYDFVFQTAVNIALLCLAPVVVLVVDFSSWLLPALVLPILAVRRGSREAVLTEHQALHDALTALPNRTLLRDRCERAIAVAGAHSGRVGLLVMDLDGFKEVNDALGHACGDQLLGHVAARLAEAVPQGDTIARLGGDEFAVLLPEVEGPDAALAQGHRLLAALEDPFELMGLRLDVDGSIGVVVYPDHGEDVDALLRHADVAMYAAKRGKSGTELYDPERDASSAERLTLMADLRRALATNELVLHYHPKVDLVSGRVQGVEALVRWHHPERGIVPPLDFIPFAEQTGLIAPLTERVLELALRQCAAWHAQGLDLSVAVNVSARNLLDGALPATVARLLEDTGVPPRLLALELTESAVMTDPARAEGVLRALSAMGVELAIDDFGTGYSSLAYLSRLPVDEMKIDRAFVSRVDDNGRDWVIVESSIALARRLGMRVVAEGVETEEARARLAAVECDLAQGFLFTRPLPASELETWLIERGESSAEAAKAVSWALSERSHRPVAGC